LHLIEAKMPSLPPWLSPMLIISPGSSRAAIDPEADVDALLNSYAEERWGYVNRVVQPTTDMMERFESAPTFLRVAAVWLGDKLLGVGESAPAVTRRVSMLDVVYGRSGLLRS
jgi:hypothetical protein